MVKFSSAINNSKLRKLAEFMAIPYSHIAIFDLPAGYTCPGADICKSFANKRTGHIIDGKNSTIRCYAASNEVRYKNVRSIRWSNYDSLRGKSVDEMTQLILSAIPARTKIIRLHSSGDFFSHDYFRAWVRVAQLRQDITFFGYTKVLYAVLEYKPSNLHLIYSHGGIWDKQADQLGIAQVYMVTSGDCNPPAICNQVNEYMDYLYILENKSFSIVIHGVQPKKGK